jgi:hypothetical protein
MKLRTWRHQGWDALFGGYPITPLLKLQKNHPFFFQGTEGFYPNGG